MKIQIKHNSKIFYIQAKPIRKSPIITPFRRKAWEFDNLGKCANVRDDVLEYFPNAVITG